MSIVNQSLATVLVADIVGLRSAITELADANGDHHAEETEGTVRRALERIDRMLEAADTRGTPVVTVAVYDQDGELTGEGFQAAGPRWDDARQKVNATLDALVPGARVTEADAERVGPHLDLRAKLIREVILDKLYHHGDAGIDPDDPPGYMVGPVGAMRANAERLVDERLLPALGPPLRDDPTWRWAMAALHTDISFSELADAVQAARVDFAGDSGVEELIDQLAARGWVIVPSPMKFAQEA